MSGGGRHIVFKDMEIGAWPNGLTLDHLEKRIVWTDARYPIRAFIHCVQKCSHLTHYLLTTLHNRRVTIS